MKLVDTLAREVRFARAMTRLLSRIRHFKPDSAHTAADVVEGWARQAPDDVAIVCGDRRYTYRDYNRAANRYASWARAQGVGRGDVVALLMGNWAEYLMAWLGVVKIGAVAALINHNLQGRSLAHTVAVSGARHVILGAELVSAWRTAADALVADGAPLPQVWITGDRGELDPPGGAANADVRDLDAALAAASPILPANARAGVTSKDRCLYIYTSGTTGLPKAAVITHHRFLNMAYGFGSLMNTRSDDRVYVPLPLYHGTGGVGGVGAAITAGAAVVLRDKLSVSEFWSDVVAYSCTMFVYVGELCRYLVNAPPRSDERRHNIRRIMGNGLRPEVWPRFQGRFRIPDIVEFYGSSEGNVTFFNVDNKVGSVGRLPGYLRRIFQVRLVEYDVDAEDVVRGSDGFCVEVPPGAPGEALGRISEKVPGGRFDGYSDAGATEKKILRDVFAPGDAWFRTGDLLSRDADGYYYFVDRVGDTFRWKGENVATSEVGEVMSVFPGVREVNVYGVAVPGADGRAGMAAVVADPDLDLAGLYAYLARELPAYARPLFLRMRPEMEVTGTFKHRKVALVADGFDPARVADPLYVRDDAAGAYVPLDAARYAHIASGEVKL